jgi:hypothetical protein
MTANPPPMSIGGISAKIMVATPHKALEALDVVTLVMTMYVPMSITYAMTKITSAGMACLTKSRVMPMVNAITIVIGMKPLFILFKTNATPRYAYKQASKMQQLFRQ